MSPFRRPPLDILPEQFFMRWLPVELERLVRAYQPWLR